MVLPTRYYPGNTGLVKPHETPQKTQKNPVLTWYYHPGDIFHQGITGWFYHGKTKVLPWWHRELRLVFFVVDNNQPKTLGFTMLIPW